MKKYKVKLEGLTPLLMHRNPMLDEEDEVLSGGKKGDDRNPPGKWKSYLYVDNGRIVLPEANIRAALEKAGARISIGGKRTLKQAAVAGIMFDDISLPLLVDGKEIAASDIDGVDGLFAEHVQLARALGFCLDVRPATIGQAKHVRVRPRFDKWSCEGAFEIMFDELTEPRIHELFAIAGRIAGVGDYRPSSPRRPGPFGRFRSEVCEAGRGKAWLGAARRGAARHGVAWHGEARRGMARRGEARVPTGHG
jgi:hypothetical protein